MKPSTSLVRRLASSVTAGCLAGALALPSVSVSAAPAPATETEDEEQAAPDPAAVLSQSLFEEGLQAYEAEDYAGAATSWTEAHSLMGRVPALSAGRRVLGFDLAQAQMRAYATDRDPARLAAAEPLLHSFIAWVDRPEHTMDEAEREDRERAVELLQQIEDESAQPQPAAAPPPPVVRPDPAPAAPPEPKPNPSGKGLLIAGGVSMGVSVAAVVGAALSIKAGQRAEDRYNEASSRMDFDGTAAADRDGRRANRLFLTSASAAFLLGAAGITMLTIGGLRRKRHISASAAVTPNGAAATATLRF